MAPTIHRTIKAHFTVRDTSILFARQPIYNRRLVIQGYELLFRAQDAINQRPDDMDGTLATREVLINAFSESDIATLCHGCPAYVNFNRDMLLKPMPFGANQLVIEILEDVYWDEALGGVIRTLKNQGFRLALDDYAARNLEHPLLPFADIVKLEYPHYAPDALAALVAELKRFGVVVLAEKVETQADFRLCLEAGCDLFQGYFLSRPEIVRGRKMPNDRMTVLKLLGALQAPDVDPADITQILARDPFISVRLLRLVNSAAFRRSSEITSVSMAVMALGINRIRDWASLIALGKLEDKPHALRDIALCRATLCEHLAQHLDPARREHYFTIGLFSCLDAFFDQPLSAIIAQMPLHPSLHEALVERRGRGGLALHTALLLERGELDQIRWDLLARFTLDAPTLSTLYQDALATAQSLL